MSTTTVEFKIEFSPQPWGCTALEVGAPAEFIVFPTAVGVYRELNSDD